MSCEKIRDQIMNEIQAPEGQPQDPALAVHLQSCASCREIYEGMVLARDMRESWQDEPVPHWDRHRHLIQGKARTSFLRTWMPLAACLLLGLLLFSRAELVSDAKGWHLSFAGAGQQEAMRAAVAEMGEQIRQQNMKELEALLQTQQEQQHQETQALLAEFGQRQGRSLDAMLAATTRTVKEEQSASFKTLISGIQEQRNLDMLWVQQRFENVLLRQDRTHDNLNKIASYVTRDSSRRTVTGYE